jgi:hypothetical protein
MAFNVMAANCDDHTKNISFILREGKEWELASAYDVTHAHNPQGEWTRQHLMAVNGRFSDISRNGLGAVGSGVQGLVRDFGDFPAAAFRFRSYGTGGRSDGLNPRRRWRRPGRPSMNPIRRYPRS